MPVGPLNPAFRVDFEGDSDKTKLDPVGPVEPDAPVTPDERRKALPERDVEIEEGLGVEIVIGAPVSGREVVSNVEGTAVVDFVGIAFINFCCSFPYDTNAPLTKD